MDIEELKLLLKQERISPATYSLVDEDKDEAYSIRYDAENGWYTFYSERGLQSNIKYFQTEDAACKHFLETVLRDPTVKMTE